MSKSMGSLKAGLPPILGGAAHVRYLNFPQETYAAIFS